MQIDEIILFLQHMNTILVTGCAGFIGSHVCELLLAKGFRVIGVDNFDPFYPKEIKEDNLKHFSKNPNFTFYEIDICNGLQAIKENDILAIIHLAAKAGVRPSIEDPEGYIRANITGTQKVHEFMQQKAIKKLVFASSSSVYGNNVKVPFSEEDNVDNPISPYAFTKKAGELMNYTFHHLYKGGPYKRDYCVHFHILLLQCTDRDHHHHLHQTTKPPGRHRFWLSLLFP